jgi:Asp-tRNA(Asn)/Glu-tRNA(Gln) amidotransferase A subunit family amidase
MATSLESLRVLMSAVVGARPWEYDPKTVEREWDGEFARGGKEGKRCFAVMWTDGLVRPHPPIERGMRECVEKLRAAGHEGARSFFSAFLRSVSLHSTVVSRQRESSSDRGLHMQSSTGAPSTTPELKRSFLASSTLMAEKTSSGGLGTLAK